MGTTANFEPGMFYSWKFKSEKVFKPNNGDAGNCYERINHMTPLMAKLSSGLAAEDKPKKLDIFDIMS